MFTLGLLLLGIAGVLTAVAVWRSGVLPRYAGVPFAVGFALLIPQFFGPAAIRIGHGVLLAAGLGWLGLALWTVRTSDRRGRSDAPTRVP
jgi:hypothetical protein